MSEWRNHSQISSSVSDAQPDPDQNHGDLVIITDLTIRTALSAMLFTLYALALASNMAIIYYERVAADMYRTLVNKMTAAACAYNALLATANLPVIALKFLFHKDAVIFPPLVCRLIRLSNVSLITQIVLSYNQIVWIRYLYVFKLGTVGSIREDLVGTFMVLVNFLLGAFASMIMSLLSHRHDQVAYQLCGKGTHTK